MKTVPTCSVRSFLTKIVLLLAYITAMVLPLQAHQIDRASLTLAEAGNEVWVMQLNSSLTALQYLVEQEFGKDVYATPQEFEQLASAALRQHLRLSQTSGTELSIDSVRVQLGHESRVLFQLAGLSADWQEIDITFTGLAGIDHSTCRLVVHPQAGEGATAELTSNNDFSATVHHSENDFAISTPSVATAGMPALGGMLLYGAAILAFFIFIATLLR